MFEAPTPALRAQATAPVSRHMATSTEYTRAEPDRLMRSPMDMHLGSVSSRVALPTPASTPVGMSMAAIPSNGGVSIQVPSANRDEVENGTLRPGAFHPPFQPPMTTTSGWYSTGTLPAWSAAPATPTPVNYGNWWERYGTSTRAGVEPVQQPRVLVWNAGIWRLYSAERSNHWYSDQVTERSEGYRSILLRHRYKRKSGRVLTLL
ncbi:hypothetical protein PC128_g14847 [Phytophthora cactorum]|nr:hypothetical protein PC128_g14847 [Phytophthora cactorum]